MAIKLTDHDWEVAAHITILCRKTSYSTEPMDLEKAKSCISKLYKMRNWEVTQWVTCASPHAAKEWILKNRSQEHLRTFFYGSQEAYWIYFLMYVRDHLKLPIDNHRLELLNIWEDISKACGWWFMIDQSTCAICDRPCEIHLDEHNNYHATDKYAIKYRDGWGACVVNGLNIEEKYEPYILDNKLITNDFINTIDNTEQQRTFKEILGKTQMELK